MSKEKMFFFYFVLQRPISLTETRDTFDVHGYIGRGIDDVGIVHD